MQKSRIARLLAAGVAVAGLAFGTGAAEAVPPPTATVTASCPNGGVVRDVAVPLTLGEKLTPNGNLVNILLPPGYCDRANRHMSYPVLYLLHGAGDTYNAWLANTDLQSFYNRTGPDQPIIVMPDAGHNAQAGWYSDWLDQQYQWETYHIKDLQAYIEAAYRTIPGDIGIAGLSMGGFGAMSYAERNQHMFKVAASFSGALDMLYAAPATGVIFSELQSQYGTPGDGVWGNQRTDRANWEKHNPASLAANLKGTGTVVLLACGTGTPGGKYGDQPTNPGGYALENGVFQMNLSMVRALNKAGVPYQSHFYPGGYHGWLYWQADMHWALPIIENVLGPPQKIPSSANNP